MNNKKIENFLPNLQKNISLKNYTTFKIGGKAKYFFAAKSKKDLIKAATVAIKNKLPFFILGRGSNVLINDKGFNGLIIKIQNSKIKMFTRQNFQRKFRRARNESSKCKISCEAGTPLALVVSKATTDSLTGLEWGVGIPGTIGGAIFGNAGAFGKSMADIVKSVEVLEIIGNKNQNACPPKPAASGAGRRAKFKNQNDKSKFKIRKLKNRECNFGYRNSIFKQNKNLIILSAILQLKKKQKKEIKKKIQENLKSRAEKQPLSFSSSGSVFKNPAPKQGLVRGRPTGFSAGRPRGRASLASLRWRSGPSAGELIEKCGLKGKRIGNVKISEKHANFIINLGKGRAKDVKKLIDLAKKQVKNRLGTILEEEIQYLGFRN